MIYTTLALAIVHLQNFAVGFSYSSESDHYHVCSSRDSCAPYRKEDEDHLWGNYTCECGPHCVRYGTCCWDSPHAGTTLHVERRGERCEKQSPYFAENVALVSRCSDRWRYGQRTRDMCDGRIVSAEDPLSALPFTSAATGVTYKNHFCAACNFDDRDVRPWDVALIHDKDSDHDSNVLADVTKDYLLRNLVYCKNRESWGLSTVDHTFLKLRLLFQVPPVLQKVVKKCHPLVSDCDASHASDYRLRCKCLSYYSPVMLKKNKKYRNVHCAICNGVQSVEDLVCASDVLGRKKPSFSFAHLIDVTGDVAGRGQSCAANQMWDPFSRKCRSLACALPGYVIKDGKCVKS